MTETEFENIQREREEERRIKKLRKLKDEAITCLSSVLKDDKADRQSKVRAAQLILQYATDTYEKLGEYPGDAL